MLCRYSQVGLLLSLLLLPIYSLKTIISLGSAADALSCAHFLSLLLLPIYLLGPIISLGHAADLLVWAHYFFGVCCQCPWMSSLSSLLLLSIYLLGPIADASNALGWEKLNLQ